MTTRYLWSLDQVESFFRVLQGSYQDYLVAKELRRMDEFYEMIGSCIGASGLIVQNFLKKTGRSYREILLQAETSEHGEDMPERKLRGSARVYALYEQYHQMYSLGSKEAMSLSACNKIANVKQTLNAEQASTSATPMQPPKSTVRKRKFMSITQRSQCPPKRCTVKPTVDQTIVEEAVITPKEEYIEIVDNAYSTDTREHVQRRTCTSKSEAATKTARRNSMQHADREAPADAAATTDEGIFGPKPDFQEQFLKLMKSQNEILANIADELNLIRHAVLDVNGLTAITYVK